MLRHSFGRSDGLAKTLLVSKLTAEANGHAG